MPTVDTDLARLQADMLAGFAGVSDDTAEPDPLADVAYTDDLPTDSLAELDALHAAFRKRSAQEQKRFRRTTDSEYWVAVCFDSREQKNLFLKNAGLTHLGDKYIDGHAAAQALNINMMEA